jgi:GT2 family glycosyltransferase
MSTPKIVTIVLNTNRRDDTLACLGSLANSHYPNIGIMVLDNASTDGSVEAIQAAFPSVQVVRLADNLGYAGNNNVGIKLALEQGADWAFVLNEDTLVEPDCLPQLIETAQSQPSLGVIGPMVYTFDEGARISSAGGVIDWWHADSINAGMGELDRGQYAARRVNFINGCGLLVSRRAVEKAGLLDASFFIYFEETDWCVRIAKAGFKIYFEPAARMRHKAPIDWHQFGPSTLYYMTRNRIRFFARHAPLLLKPISVAQAVRGALAGARQHEREGRLEHARATHWAITHAFQQHWGKAEATLWRSDATDRSLHRTPGQP